MESECGFEGNSDLYGLGVRLGIYVQWATSVLAEHLYEPAISECRDVNTTFQIAMLAGLMLITTNVNTETLAVEGYVTLLFCFASAWLAGLQALSATRISRSTGIVESRTQNARRIGDLLLSIAVCSYGVWFLTRALDGLPRTNATCPEVVFFFAAVPLYGWFRALLTVVLALGLVAPIIMTCLRALALAREFSETVRRLWAQPPSYGSSAPPGLVRIASPSARKLLASLAGMVVFVLAVELTLVWNGVYGVYSCSTFSQLFPLVVGATNFARVAYQLLKSVLVGDTRLQWRF
ncbi:hypothetical protein DL765_008488 [Monosporascus sp. GIB2]|nr:hypothetical protein DL765_008488 [Monosporascus sp. GIB2]